MGNGDIPIHPKKGLDPHMCFCPRCGGENGELAIGHMFKAVIESTGQTVFYNRGKRKNVEKELKDKGLTLGLGKEAEEGDKIPGGLCKACKKELEEHRNIVCNEKGIYFKCRGCGTEGVLRRAAVEAMWDAAGVAKIDAGRDKLGRIGVEFNTCAKCSDKFS